MTTDSRNVVFAEHPCSLACTSAQWYAISSTCAHFIIQVSMWLGVQAALSSVIMPWPDPGFHLGVWFWYVYKICLLSGLAVKCILTVPLADTLGCGKLFWCSIKVVALICYNQDLVCHCW